MTRGDGPYAVLAIGLAPSLPELARSGAIARVPLPNPPRPRNSLLLAEHRGLCSRASRPALAPPQRERQRERTRARRGGGASGPAGRLDVIQVKDIRQWLNRLAVTCQCCAQGKDASRPEGKSGVARSENAATKRYRHLAAKTHETHYTPR